MIDAPAVRRLRSQADLEFETRLRGMERFAGVAALTAQMAPDVEHARASLA